MSPLTDTSTETDTGVGLLEGKPVQRWRCDPPAKTLKLDYRADDGEYFTIRPLETYRRARFVIRQTARHPIVGPKRGTEYFRNSLLALFDPDNGYDVGYVVGLLNSRLIRFLYTTSVRESAQASFPQVKVGSLRDLPVIWPNLDAGCHTARENHSGNQKIAPSAFPVCHCEARTLACRTARRKRE